MSRRARRAASVAAAVALLAAGSAQARVTRIVVDEISPLIGEQRGYEQLRGRAFGELDPADPHNAVITDLTLGADAEGKVRYETNWVLTRPVGRKRASGFLWHDVPNRGGEVRLQPGELAAGDIGLRSGWQADNAGNTGVPAVRPEAARHHYVRVPVARIDGKPVTGRVMARIVNRAGLDSQPLLVQGNPMPYLPVSLDTAGATLTVHAKETVDGQVTVERTIDPKDWAFARCDVATPFPGTPINIDPARAPANLPVHVCVRGGFEPGKVYQLTYTAGNAYVLGVGMAAFRDVGAFFRHAKADDAGTPNPIAGQVRGSAIRGVSQSGNMVRQFLFMGLNQDESNRQVHDGAWAIIAGRRVAANARWAQPDGVLELFQMGSEGPQWWVAREDRARGLPAKGLLTRCTATKTCPKVFEHFGAAEVYALKLSLEWVGSSADADIPLGPNVRRYYVAGSPHGGGAGGFRSEVDGKPFQCPGNNFGQATLAANPVPHRELRNVLSAAMRAWVLKGTPPPPSRYPTLADGELVDPTREAMGFPRGVPGIPESIFKPENFVFPVLDYDWGPGFDRTEASGVPDQVPPRIRSVLPAKVPRVDADGNEVGGVPTVLTMAPLGTYLGWNITADGIHAGQVCNYAGGYVPFARTRAEREARGDPRLSLEERYKDRAGYLAAVKAATDRAMAQGFLLPADRDRLLKEAAGSDVLR
ncbi:alpha/beta hydrolase domain-containing protein [Mitsuaria sp. GD03876]|uniref:alpha/beta hydrolase domain-containing protein n=1 Tax=Mitsuaria sp. GD03876 TaxID=2975399 RepID=UPI002447E44D|nr:alpha/beta hydrolase domain-containing protein [Mitsuaria sp. GD03876]MDH0865562.1 alpha/beta hydrolase domain-containing protein [Mitsuaria sp. GD03876]